MRGGPPADPGFEAVGKGKGIFVADSMSDGFNGFAGGCEHLLGALHAQEGQLLQRTTAQVLAAQTPQMLMALALHRRGTFLIRTPDDHFLTNRSAVQSFPTDLVINVANKANSSMNEIVVAGRS